MKKYLVYAGLLILLLFPAIIRAVDPASPIVNSPHNLANWASSTTSPVRATSTSEVCKFCHLAHGATTRPLWGHRLSTATYRVYSSQSLRSPRNQPDGGSKLCLSCHDGTVAVGGTVKGDLQVAGSATYLGGTGNQYLIGPASWGTNLNSPANSHLRHPLSIAVTAQLVTDVATNVLNDYDLKALGSYCTPTEPGLDSSCLYRLKKTSYLYKGVNATGVQCTSCHDPHDDTKNTYATAGKFLPERVNYNNYSCGHFGPSGGKVGGTGSQKGFCMHCHTKQPADNL